jgi:hypothetical protein
MVLSIFPVYSDVLNPSRQELENMIVEISNERGVPPVLVMALARVESVFKHYNVDGTVLRGSRGSIGLMQINNRTGYYDENRLMYDIPYNINAGIDVLISKWEACISDYLPYVGDMNPNILENWYFALWGYNGFVASNNPNVAHSLGKETFQDMIYRIALDDYGQKINSIDISYLPETGVPSKYLKVPTPEEVNYADIFLAEIGDNVKVYSKLNLRDIPDGKKIGEIYEGEVYTVSKEPEFARGYYWYYLTDTNGNDIGWAARNWLVVTKDEDIAGNIIEESLDNINEFLDIQNYWGKDYIIELYNEGIIKGRTNNIFDPEANVTRQEFAALLTRSFEFDPLSIFDIADKENIAEYAFDSINTMVSLGIIETEDGNFMPLEPLTRIDAALAISRILGYPEKINDFSFKDVSELSEEQLNGLRGVYTLGIINGKSNDAFAPFEPITRGEMSKILVTARYQYQ